MLRSQLRKRVMAAAAAAVVVNASDNVSSTPRAKLSIYPEPDPQIVLVDTPSALEKQIGTAREAVTEQYNGAHNYVQGWVTRWIGIEHAVENRLKSFKDPSESLTPSLLYVGVAALTGSVLARSRGLPTRLFLPPTLTLLAFNHFLPKTAENVGDYYGELEERYVPRFAKFRTTGVAHSYMGWEMAKDRISEGRGRVEGVVKDAVGAVQERTGLKVKEVMRWKEGKEGEKVERK